MRADIAKSSIGLVVLILALLPGYTTIAQDSSESQASVKSFALLVHDYDEAIKFYTESVGFELVSDQSYGENMRWVSLKAPGSEIQFSLGKALEGDEAYVGKQGGKNYPLFVLAVPDVWKTYEEMVSKGVSFIEEPTQKPWGLGAIFEDLYGNKIYLQTK